MELFGGFSNTFTELIYWENVSPRGGMKNWCTAVEGMSGSYRHLTVTEVDAVSCVDDDVWDYIHLS